MKANNQNPSPLSVTSLPLRGTHLIEASAGTGKTFNITRIYLRLLLESKMSVTQILVMTYTNAATQELRGRLTETLQQAKQYWQSYEYREANPDPVFDELFVRCCPELSLSRLSLALVEMDEATIFTLHGFCQRILKQMAFSTGNALQITLQNDQQKALQRSVNDWFRLLREVPDKLTLLAQRNWHTPDAFLNNFESLIFSSVPALQVDIQTIESDHRDKLAALSQRFAADFEHHLEQVTSQQSTLYQAQVASQKKVALQQQRECEFEQLLAWLQNRNISNIPDGVGLFLNGNRYKGGAKENIKSILKPIADMRKAIIAEVKAQQESTQKRQQELPLFEIVAEGVAFIKERIANEKAQRGEVSFDDLIQLLSEAVADDDKIAEQLVQTFPAALVDEFQDTDAMQYKILSKVYVEQPSLPKGNENIAPLLVMIGDPKQAIYGFRGGDIFTYLRARGCADYVWYMDTNWRSTEHMVKAYNRVFWGNALDQVSQPVFGYGIRYEQVHSTPNSAAAKRPLGDLNTTERSTALTYFIADQTDLSVATPAQQKSLQHAQLSQWCVAEIKRLLCSVTLGDNPVKAADIAILVRNRKEAERIGEHLRGEGLTAVYLSDKTPLFSSRQAHELLLVMTGIWHCDSDSALIRALSSSLLGADRQSLAKMHHDPLAGEWSLLRKRTYEHQQIWLEQGVMALLLGLLKAYYQPTIDGERDLTNYLHLTELLEQASRQHSHPLQLLQWLRKQTEHIEADEQYEQRLESDAGLIKIITQHKSKGLEYPFVFVPYVNEYRDPSKQNNSTRRIFRYYDPQTKSQIWQLGQSERAIQLLREQEQAENIRLLYVAITRAEYQCYLGIGEYPDSELSPIGLALGKQLPQNIDISWHQFLSVLCQDPDNYCNVKLASQLPEPQQQVGMQLPFADLMAKTSLRGFEQKWRVHSFSGLTRFSGHDSWTEREKEISTRTSENAKPQSNQMRYVFPKGATPGNFIHDVFEHTDFCAPDWQLQCEIMNTKYALVEATQIPDIVQWFEHVIDTPIEIGDQQSSIVTLRQLSPVQTLREAEFYFPITSFSSQDLLVLLAQHRQHLYVQGLLSSEPLTAHFQLSRSRIEGMMHGFIDLIFEYDGKFYVADYKSTYLGASADAYHPSALAENNALHAYDLQYLIYAVALHRYLQQQLPNYQPALHFGGVCYLYARGMCGMPKKPTQTANHSTGVFFTRIDTPLLLALDAVFSASVETNLL